MGGKIPAGLDHPIRRKIFQVGNGDRLLYHLAPAAILTGMGTNPPNAGRHGQALLDDPHGFLVIPPGNGLDISLGIDAGGAVEHTGTPAVAVVVTHEQLNAGFPGPNHPLRFCIDHLAILRHRGTGPQKFGASLRFHHTEAAAAVMLEFSVVAEVRDLNAVVLGDFQEGLTSSASTNLTVNNDFNSRFHSMPLPS